MKPENRVTLGLALIFVLLLVILTMEFIHSTRQVITDQTAKVLDNN